MKQDESSARVRFGAYEADLATQEIWKDSVRLKLARQPFEILAMLVSRPGELISREELQRRLWPEHHFVDASHGLNAAVNKLRETLCDSAEDPKYIETLPRRGYRFIGVVDLEKKVIADEEEIPVPSLPGAERQGQGCQDEASSSSHSPEIVSSTVGTESARRWPILVAASVALVAGGFIGAWLNPGARGNTDAGEAVRKEAAEKREIQLQAARREENVVRPATPAASRNRQARVQPEVLLPGRELRADLRPAEFRTIISGQGGNAAPQFSPDGSRIAFMSNRSGPWQIWMSNADGSDPVQFSFTDSAGTPRWSPDGKSLVFDAPWDGSTFVFLAPVNQPQNARPVAEGCVPSFSRDGKYVYFASDRSGQFEVWKVAVAGGPEIQITRHGGFAALESADGNLYYSKSKYPNPEIWRVPLNGGDEESLSPISRPRTWASWTVTKDGILLVADLPDGRSHLTLYDPTRGTARDLTSLRTSPFWMAASADGKRVVMNDAAEQQITMVDHLR